MKRTFPVTLVCLFLSTMYQSAHADYFVMYEDLYPTSQIQARAIQREQPKATPTGHQVLFAKGRSFLSLSGRSTLTVLARKVNGASILIVGRPDVALSNTGNLSGLALNRAISIRDHLTRRGVPIDSITIETEDAPNPQQSSDIYITQQDNQVTPARLSAAHNAQPQPYTPAQPYAPQPATAVAPAAGTKPVTRAELLRLISQAIQSGEMRPTEAMELLRAAVSADISNESNQVAPQAAPILINSQPAKPTAPIAQPVSFTVANRNEAPQAEVIKIQAPQITTWEILNTDVTLQNTFARWGAQANWEVKWINIPEIGNQGYVKLPGRDFLSVAEYVLGQAKLAAKAAGIDISITAYPNNVLVISKETQK